MTESFVLQALAARYCLPEWAFVTKLPATVGFADRITDAVAMSLWPSRGLEIHGFEVKTARSDLLRELKDPAKAEATARFCDHWWIAAPAGVAKPEELPVTWGLLVVGDGYSVRIAKKAAPLTPAEPTRAFLASCLRKLTETFEQPETVAAKIRDEFERGRRSAESAVNRDANTAESALKKVAELARTISDFERLTGLDVRSTSWRHGPMFGSAVRWLMGQTPDHIAEIARQAEHGAAMLRSVADSIRPKMPESEGAR